MVQPNTGFCAYTAGGTKPKCRMSRAPNQQKPRSEPLVRFRRLGKQKPIDLSANDAFSLTR